MSAALETAQAEAESYRRAWLREEGLARAWKARDDFSQKALEEMTMRALAAEAALLAKSAAYEALVAGCSELAAKLDRQAAENYTDRGNALSRCADDIRLLVSDDRPSHTAGDGNG